MKQIAASSLLVQRNLSADKRIITKSRSLVKSHEYVICGARRLNQSIHRSAKGANLTTIKTALTILKWKDLVFR